MLSFGPLLGSILRIVDCEPPFVPCALAGLSINLFLISAAMEVKASPTLILDLAEVSKNLISERKEKDKENQLINSSDACSVS